MTKELSNVIAAAILGTSAILAALIYCLSCRYDIVIGRNFPGFRIDHLTGEVVTVEGKRVFTP